MTSSIPQPPYPPELLADLHADNVDPDVGAQLWLSVHDDPEAQRFLHSLGEVQLHLHNLGKQAHGRHQMPPEVATRLMTYAEQLAGSSATSDSAVVSLDSRRRRRRLISAFAAAAAVTALLAGTLFVIGSTPPSSQAPTASGPTSQVAGEGGGVDHTTVLSALGRHSVSGTLSDAGTLQECVRAAGFDRTVLGSTDFTFRGTETVLILLSGSQSSQITALIVGTGCTATDPQVRSITNIG